LTRNNPIHEKRCKRCQALNERFKFLSTKGKPSATLRVLEGSRWIALKESAMWFLNMHRIAEWLFTSGTGLALLITAGIGVFLGCCVSCMCEPTEEKDDIFHKEVV
jgi:hypothetical protein